MNVDLGKIDFKTAAEKLLPLFEKLKKSLVLIVFIAIIGAYGYLVVEVNRLASQEPTEEAIAEQLKTVQIPRIDQRTLNTIQGLEDQNIQTKAIFQQARENPFSE